MMSNDPLLRFGVISDTHGIVPGPVHEAFEKVIRIYHCGDAGQESCIDELEIIAPVRLVTGNMDPSSVCSRYPDHLAEEAEFGLVAMTHGCQFGHRNENIAPRLVKEFAAAKPRVILFGHTHVPLVKSDPSGVLIVNPGSATRPRIGHSPTVALLEFNAETGNLSARHVSLGR